MKLRNGVTRNDSTLKGLEVVDNNIVRHPGMTRLQSKKKTPLQSVLDLIIQDNFKLTDQQFKVLLKEMLTIPSLNPQSSRMYSKNNQDIIDCWNDASRRYFESILAKKIMNYFLADAASDLPALIKEVQKFLIAEYQKDNPELLNTWREITEGKDVKGIEDPNLAHFFLLRRNLIILMKEGHFAANTFLLESFDLHYLTHSIASLQSYKTLHPAGGMKCYTENSLFYSAPNRGRIMGFGFNEEEPSYHLGIMRSIDRTPYDMRRPELISSETRCPDRLYMSHPKIARKRPENWLNQAFSNPYNSAYVNGLSGSILLEINTLLFFIISQKENQQETGIIDKLKHNNFALLKNYWLMISCVFIYFEGGHTFTEVMSVFNLERVKANIKETLATPAETFTLNTMMFDTPEIYALIKESLIEAAKYQSTSNNMIQLSKALENVQVTRLLKKLNAVDDLLTQFKPKITSFETQNPQIKEEGYILWGKIDRLKQNAQANPSIESIEFFYAEAQQAIDDAVSKFQNDIRWIDTLANFAKNLLNVLISFVTFNKYPNFFQLKPGNTETEAKQLYTIDFRM